MNLGDKLLRLAFRYTLMADDKATVEQAAAELERQGTALAEMREALTLCRDKISGLHDSQCDYIKSSRRSWGRREPCSCGASTRTAVIEHALSTDAGTGYVPKSQLEAQKKAYNDAIELLTAANQRIAGLEKDKARLDWLSLMAQESYNEINLNLCLCGYELRQAIDAAMSKEGK